MGTQSTWGVPNKTAEGRAIMKIIILTAAFIAGALAAPEAKADVDAWYGYYGRGYGYGGYYRPYRYYGGWYGKRSADAEPEAEAAPAAEADADAWYGYYGHGLGYYGYGYRPWGGYSSYYRPYGYGFWGKKKRSADADPAADASPEADADAWYGYYGYGYRPYGYGYHGYYRPYGYAYWG